MATAVKRGKRLADKWQTIGTGLADEWHTFGCVAERGEFAPATWQMRGNHLGIGDGDSPERTLTPVAAPGAAPRAAAAAPAVVQLNPLMTPAPRATEAVTFSAQSPDRTLRIRQAHL